MEEAHPGDQIVDHPFRRRVRLLRPCGQEGLGVSLTQTHRQRLPLRRDPRGHRLIQEDEGVARRIAQASAVAAASSIRPGIEIEPDLEHPRDRGTVVQERRGAALLTDEPPQGLGAHQRHHPQHRQQIRLARSVGTDEQGHGRQIEGDLPQGAKPGDVHLGELGCHGCTSPRASSLETHRSKRAQRARRAGNPADARAAGPCRVLR